MSSNLRAYSFEPAIVSVILIPASRSAKLLAKNLEKVICDRVFTQFEVTGFLQFELTGFSHSLK